MLSPVVPLPPRDSWIALFERVGRIAPGPLTCAGTWPGTVGAPPPLPPFDTVPAPGAKLAAGERIARKLTTAAAVIAAATTPTTNGFDIIRYFAPKVLPHWLNF